MGHYLSASAPLAPLTRYVGPRKPQPQASIHNCAVQSVLYPVLALMVETPSSAIVLRTMVIINDTLMQGPVLSASRITLCWYSPSIVPWLRQSEPFCQTNSSPRNKEAKACRTLVLLLACTTRPDSDPRISSIRLNTNKRQALVLLAVPRLILLVHCPFAVEDVQEMCTRLQHARNSQAGDIFCQNDALAGHVQKRSKARRFLTILSWPPSP